MTKRRKAKVVKIGNRKIGGNFPILVQSMTSTSTADVLATVRQIKKLEEAGCEIVRVGIPDIKAAKSILKIKRKINIPLVADIHFSDYLALECINQGADKIRINPGNLSKEGLKKVVRAAKKRSVPIRVGVNSGSLERDILKERRKATPGMMVSSAMKSIKLMESLGFHNLVISLKAPDVKRMVRAYEMLSKKTNYPFHLGITEAGGELSGTIKSAIGIGSLLMRGIGDTIRISLTADPVLEVKTAFEILKSLELREMGVKIISCPTCARKGIDVLKIAGEVEKLTEKIKKPLKIAVMGCVVNGMGEGREADIAIIGVNGFAIIMKKGKVVCRVREEDAVKKFSALLPKNANS